MRLIDLEPQFYRYAPKTWLVCDSLAEAQGVLFLCPVCFARNGGPVGTHSVLCWFRDRGVPDDEKPGPGRWEVSGTGFGDLTLSPSIHLTGEGCGWHGYIRAGEVT